jgi:hypothetical protein
MAGPTADRSNSAQAIAHRRAFLRIPILSKLLAEWRTPAPHPFIGGNTQKL